MQDYLQELRKLHHRRVNYIVLGGGLLMLLFSILDRYMAPLFYDEFLSYRIAAACCGVVLFGLNYFDKDCEYSSLLGFIGFFVMNLVVLLMIHRMGGASSSYYVGLIVAITLYVALAPLTVQQTLAVGAFQIVSYIVTLLLTHPLSAPYLGDFFSHLFFMTCFLCIIATQSWTDTIARQSEYRLRKDESEATDELSRHAEQLETEVKKRSIEQGLLEERYKQLFNQLADDVVVVSAKGKILQSNKRFQNHFSRSGETDPAFFWDIVHPDERPTLERLFKEMSDSGTPFSDGRMSLITNDGSVFQAEVNANVLHGKGAAAGILLIMRDISPRKEMEARLIESLEVKKKTETSAILALAKLSEFKDVTPLNHLERVREYCKILAEDLSSNSSFKEVMTPTYIEDIYHASILHDIGKVAIPDEYMAADAPIEEYDKDLVRRHTLVGGDVIRGMEEESKGSGFLTMAKHIAYFHHECWDGSGYPYGLSGREIPLAARIMAVADTYEEMTAGCDSVVSPAIHEKTVTHIKGLSGTFFDPKVVGSLLARQFEFDRIREEFPAS